YKSNVEEVLITGSGDFKLTGLRTLNEVQKLEIILDSDIEMTGILQGYYSSTAANPALDNNDVTITINSGRTVTFTNSGVLHGSNTKITNANFGNYTYNINGTLDMS